MNERDPRRKDEFIMTDFLIILWSLAVACLSTSIDSISDLKACHEIHLYIKTWYTHWQPYTIWIMGKMVAVEISATVYGWFPTFPRAFFCFMWIFSQDRSVV